MAVRLVDCEGYNCSLSFHKAWRNTYSYAYQNKQSHMTIIIIFIIYEYHYQRVGPVNLGICLLVAHRVAAMFIPSDGYIYTE
jgi:hypothetical protein